MIKIDSIIYGNTVLEFKIKHLDRKTLKIKVHPDKSIEVEAPIDAGIELIKSKVKSKASWIIKQQDFFLTFHPLTPERKFISGETHLYLGKQYKLKVVESNLKSVKLQGGCIVINTFSRQDNIEIKKQLREWYEKKANDHFEKLFFEKKSLAQKFFEKEPILKFKWIPKKWGTCNKAGIINLNFELIKAPKKCIEYVIVHEICHLAHLNHSNAFYNLLEKEYPDWKKTKDRLEKLLV
jgi:predicted metal-dependent hydrolase